MKDLVQKAGLAHRIAVASAATSAEEIGNPVYPPAREKLREHGINCRGKRAVQLCRADYDRYDLLIGMDRWNLRNMLRIVGSDPKGKLRPLLPDREVADPWYTGDFDATWNDVTEGCQALLEELRRNGAGRQTTQAGPCDAEAVECGLRRSLSAPRSEQQRHRGKFTPAG